MEDFGAIKETMDKLQVALSSLQLWLDEQMANGEIDPESL